MRSKNRFTSIDKKLMFSQGKDGGEGRELMENALESDFALFVINQVLKVRRENFNHVLK